MKRMLFVALLGISVGGFSETTTAFSPCEKTYVDPFHIDIHDKKIHVDDRGESFETSALYSDESGLYYKDFLEKPKPIQEQEEEPIEVIDIAPVFEEDLFTTDEQVDLSIQEENEEEVVAAPTPPKQTVMPSQPTPKQKPALAPSPVRNKPKRSWPFGKNRHS